MSDRRRDYGPAGCLDGCAQGGDCGCLVMLVGMLMADVTLVRRKRKR